MRRIVLFGLLGGVGLGLVFAFAESPWKYLSEEGLRERVQLEVGRTGPDPHREIWQIQPTGEWQRTERGTLHEKGQLTTQQQQALAHYLAIHEFDTSLTGSIGLPVEDLVGDEARWFIILRVGEKRAVLVAKEPPILTIPPVIRLGRKDKVARPEPVQEEVKPKRWERLVLLSQAIPAILMSDKKPTRWTTAADKDRAPAPADKDKAPAPKDRGM